MIDIDTVEDLLSDASSDPSAWHRALEKVSSDIGARGAFLMPIGGKTLGPISTGSLEETGEIYNVGEWQRHDVRALGRRKLLQTGIVADQDFISPDAMQRHALWRGFLEPAGLRWYCGVLVRAGDDLWNLALERTPEQGRFSSKNRKLSPS